MNPANIRGAGLALAGFAVFSLHDAVVKALGAHYHAIQIVFFSVLIGFPLVVLMLIRERDGSLRPRRPFWTALRTVAVMATMLSAFYAFSAIPFAQAYAIIFATPLIITALSVPILGERVGLRRWAAVVLGLIGVLIVLRPGADAGLGPGHLAALVAAGAGALVAVIMRKIGNEERSAVLLLYPMLANAAVTGCLLPFVYQPMAIAHLGGMGLVALGALGGMLLMILAYRAGEAGAVAPMQYSQMLWAVGLGMLLFDETPDAATMLGSAVIVASGLFVFLREGRGRVSITRPALHSADRPGLAPEHAAHSAPRPPD
ncbi:DMT family transporter [Rhodovulum sp.]|uniref:DMT family transporter n=1 Tax=Rhodovulum sp. TaxID=34009 RepID=UPI0017948AF4|nr:DMT family transporter [Rhodovulum sp.]HDR27888.1 DMT family transporter [Rhodovulum sp.]